MNIAGMQPMTLSDFPGKIASIIFTQGCILSCGYCHNPDLIPMKMQPTITEDSALAFLRDHKKMLDGVCITGGEPTLQKDLIRFIEKVKEIGCAVKLDTNGIHPDVIRDIISLQVCDYFAMDLKAPWEKYPEVTRRGPFLTDRIKETFYLIQESSVDHEFRTTLHPALARDDHIQMAEYLVPTDVYYLQDLVMEKMLEPSLERPSLSASEIAMILRGIFPSLTIRARSY